MSIFSKKTPTPVSVAPNPSTNLADTALEIIQDGLILVDTRGIIKNLNPAALRITGYDHSETGAIGLNYTTVLNIEDGNELTKAFQDNQSFELNNYQFTPNAQQKPITISITLKPTSPNAQEDRIIIIRDITNASTTANQQTDFVATASHEMRTPIASIEGYLSLVLNPQTATIDERARKYIEEAHDACQHLGHLFRDLLDVSKLDDGATNLHFVPVNITDTVKDIIDRYDKTQILQKNLQLTIGSDNNVGVTQIRQPLYCSVDIDALQEIMDNLIENAVKYTPEGGTININTTNDQSHVFIDVSDTGIGIGAEDIKHLFQKFYRVDNSQTRTIGGTGLGLYIVKQRVESLQGSIAVQSTPGVGSTFRITLPRLSESEYEKMRIAIDNETALEQHQLQKQIQNNINQPQGGNNG